MKKFLFTLLLLLFALPCIAADTYVAVVETVSENGAIGRSEKMFLTDKLRERAKKVLPGYMGYVIMTRENIQQMLPSGKKIEDCEGECLVETGKNINAHYIAQARVGKFGNQLTLTVELYETMGNNLVGSFTAMGSDAMVLLKEIERQADGMFATISAGKGGGNFGGSDGFSDMDLGGGSGYKVSGVKSYIVNVGSNPSGAMVSVDGRPNADCSKTPCDVTLTAGSHRFSFGMKMYFDKDTVFDVTRAGQKLQVQLNPNFGTLTLAPQLQSGIGAASDLSFEIDGSPVSGSQFRLAPGKHSISISHRCYEPARFNVSINNGSDLKFDRALQPIMGGLDLKAVESGKPKPIPVYVNGAKTGVTPFLETVPVCSKIAVGDDRKEVKVSLKKNETVTYTHNLASSSPSGAEAGAFTDSRDGQKYRTVKIGSQIWMAQNLNYQTGNSWCYYNKSSNCQKYGRLYDWYTAKKACPAGWHLPDNDEWETLWSAVGGTNSAGKKLKSKSGWKNGGNGTDAFCFSVLPAGLRHAYGDFNREGNHAYFWSASENVSDYAYYWNLYYNNDTVDRDYNGKDFGFSVRCLRSSH